MKYIGTIIALFLLTSSCNNPSKTERQQSDDFQNQKVDIEQIERLDSLSEFAWDSIKFGSTVSNVVSIPEYSKYSKIEVKRWNNDKFASINLPTTDYAIKLGLSNLQYIQLLFEDDILYRIELRSWDSENLYSLIKDCKRIANDFSKKYIEPSKLLDDVSYSDFEINRDLTFATFSIGKKDIWFSIKEQSSDEYYYNIVITHLDYPDIMKKK